MPQETFLPDPAVRKEKSQAGSVKKENLFPAVRQDDNIIRDTISET